MNKQKKMETGLLKKLQCTVMALLLALSASIPAFAEEPMSEEISAYLSYTVIPESIDVVITDRIILTGNNESPCLDVTDIIVENRSRTLSVRVDSVSVQTTEPPWSLVPESAGFAAMELNQYQFALTADGQDLSVAALIPSSEEVEAGTSKTIVMEGYTGPISETVQDTKIATLVVTVSPVDYGALAAQGIIEKVVPQGGIYTKADGTVIAAGGKMPETPSNLDMLEYGDYTYRYNAYLKGTNTVEVPEMNGWNAKANDLTKLSYEPIVHTIQGIYVTSLDYCYVKCEFAPTMPAVPEHVTRMTNTFEQCWELAGEVEINCNPVLYNNCFVATRHDIVIVGACSNEMKAKLANTCNFYNVTWK